MSILANSADLVDPQALVETVSPQERLAAEQVGLPVIPTAQRRHVESLRDWIATRTGLHFGERKLYTLYRRLDTLCWKLGIPSLEELDRQLRQECSSQLALRVACVVSTNHTFFFREQEVLDQFQRIILPQLPTEGTWRIWSAAASSGEEAYTVAILLAEALGLEQAQQRVAILGTDISQPMIEQAEHAIYADKRMEMVPPAIRERYFQPVGLGQWRIIPALRQMCTFRRMNLQSTPWPFKNSFQVILCRNVLYYFDQPQQQQLVENLYDVAAPGSWLLTSVTETLHGLRTRWRKMDAGVLRKLDGSTTRG